MAVNSAVARHLGHQLRTLRTSAKLSVRRLGAEIGIDPSLLSKYELGQRPVPKHHLAAILDALHVGDALRVDLLAMARDVQLPAWLALTMPERQRQMSALLEFERAATRIVDVSPMLITGLLQTAEYVRDIMTASAPPGEVETRVAVRAGRRDILTREVPTDLVAVICAPALRQMVGGPQVSARQLRHLLAMAERPNVDIRVVPADRGWHPGLEGHFSIIQFSDATPIVHLETRTSGLFLHDPRDVAAYQDAATKVLRRAMTAEESLETIAHEVDRIERMT